MKLFSNGAGDFVIDCQPEDRELLTSDLPWTALDRGRVQRALDALVCGSLDAVGIPRMALPSEFVAGAIAVAVRPINLLLACHFVADRVPTYPASLLASDPNEPEAPTISAQQLLSMVLTCNQECGVFRSKFRKRLEIVERSALVSPGTNSD